MQQAKKIGKYEIGKILGKGNFSKVRVAIDSTNGEKYAIKIIDKALLARDHLEDQIRREISILKVLRHKYIVQMREAFQTTKHMYVVMELVEGGELFDVVADQGRLSEDLARKYFQQLIVAVKYCHQNKIAHRDLKLENLLLDLRGNLKISDFGLANMQPTPESSVMRTVCGTPNYVAPEVIKMNSQPRNAQTGERVSGYNGFTADIWSCGIILFIMLSGRQAFDDEDLKALFNKIERGQYSMSRHIGEKARGLIDRMLVTDPNQRITLQEIIDHPWFQVNFDPSELNVGHIGTILDEEAITNAVTLVDPALSPNVAGTRAPAGHQQNLGRLVLGSSSVSPSAGQLDQQGNPAYSPMKLNQPAVGNKVVPIGDGLDGFQLANALISNALLAPPFIDLGNAAIGGTGGAAAAGHVPKRATPVSTPIGASSPPPQSSTYPVYGGIRQFVVAGTPAQTLALTSEWLKTVLPSALRGSAATSQQTSVSTHELRGFLTTPRGIMTFVLEVVGTAVGNISMIVGKKGMGDTADFLETLKGFQRKLVENKVLLSSYAENPNGNSPNQQQQPPAGSRSPSSSPNFAQQQPGSPSVNRVGTAGSTTGGLQGRSPSMGGGGGMNSSVTMMNSSNNNMNMSNNNNASSPGGNNSSLPPIMNPRRVVNK